MKNGKGDYGIISLAEYYEGKEKDVSVRKGHENATNERQRRENKKKRGEKVDGEKLFKKWVSFLNYVRPKRN